MLQLTDDNYYSTEADKDYMSASQFKSFQKCEAETMAELKGLYTPPDARALFVGQYMDQMFSDEDFDNFKFVNHTKIYTKTGSKRADIQAADEAFKRAARDKMFCEYMDGNHQTIFTGDIAGVKFKGKLDSLLPDKIVDLKYIKDLEPKWQDGERKTFIDVYGYDLQLAIYRELVAQHNGGEYLPCYIAAITKESTPQIAIIEIPDWKLNSALEIVKHFAPIYQEIKEGLRTPERCEHCDFCKNTKVLTKPMSYEDLLIA